MQLLALAGGAGPGGEDVLGCCGWIVVLPLVVLLAGWSVYRNAIWPACLALALALPPHLILRGMVARYQPSDDWEIMDEQAKGRMLVGFYAWLAAVAAAALLYVVIKRLVLWMRSDGTRGPQNGKTTL